MKNKQLVSKENITTVASEMKKQFNAMLPDVEQMKNPINFSH